MSYSFQVIGMTKADVKEAVKNELTKVVESQPIHETDAAHALTTAETFLGVMTERSDREIVCGINGSIWQTDDGIEQVSVAVNLSHAKANA